MPRLSVTVPEDLKERIDKIAERDRTSIALVFRELVEMGIDARENWKRAPKLQLPEEK